MLVLYWFPTDASFGLGVTAHSIQDAIELLSSLDYVAGHDFDPSRVVENVSVTALDQSHVVPNMGPVVVRGVWFPCRNL